MSEWVATGQLTYREQIAQGIENAPAAFIGMLQGATAYVPCPDTTTGRPDNQPTNVATKPIG